MLSSIVLGCTTQQELVTYTYLEKLSGKKTSSYGDNGYIYICI